MPRTVAEIVSDIRGFTPVDGNWLPLDSLLQELWQTGQANIAIADLVNVFERFPEEDGAGVFWAILHQLEAIPGSDDRIVASVLQQPSEFPVMMIRRMLNANQRTVGTVDLLELLRSVAANCECSQRVRQIAERFVKRHQGRIDNR